LLLSKKKDISLFQQSRLAYIGETVSMIAHQWRQPISAISSTAIDMKMKMELDVYDFDNIKDREECFKYFNNSISEIEEIINILTTTIDDFRNFYKPNKKLVKMKLEDIVAKSLRIIRLPIINYGIEILEEYNSKQKIELYDNEMMQVILNIINNAKDHLIENKIKNPYIKITIEDKSISICDNGGGIPENIVDKIFDPYFSTKDEKNGTGLGLYMSKIIVEEHHNGQLIVKNESDGACFTIKVQYE